MPNPAKMPENALERYRFGQVVGDMVEIDPLESKDGVVWRLHEEGSAPTDVVPIANIQQTIDAEYGQEMDADRISNPHGEHAHEVWRIYSLP